MSRAARLALLIAFLTLQFVVPAALLFGRRPMRFGWQMFSAYTVAPIVVGVRSDGAREELRVDDYFAFRRGDIAPAAFSRLPAHICRVEPELGQVIVRRAPGAQWETHACR